MDVSGEKGPVNAIFEAVQNATGYHLTMREYKVDAVSGGPDAQGEVIVLIEKEGEPGTVYRGPGVSTDVIEATSQKYIQAYEKITGRAF